ncbi:membrane protein required for colicin V production [Saccharicrinis carchari]|uniref:Membrane protein required for colicin V production n=1 Tax=Saccharicrinis carchari TaxID=1168039 RepID=A0A521CSA5_SACCC|nr:CvpA family protein [Saccharicrinis carchari]SMO62278.1 membrane protein required for colicin V production [Saccharicrinis carchari]
MNYFDIVVGVLLIIALVKGFKNGLIIEFAALAALVLGVLGAIKFSAFTEVWLMQYWQSDYINIIAFFITFIAIVIGVHLLAKLVDTLVKAVALGLVNRVLGAVFSLFKYGFVLSVLLAVFTTFDKSFDLLPEKTRERSYLYQPLSEFAPFIFPYLNFDEKPLRNKVEEIIEV